MIKLGAKLCIAVGLLHKFGILQSPEIPVGKVVECLQTEGQTTIDLSEMPRMYQVRHYLKLSCVMDTAASSANLAYYV